MKKKIGFTAVLFFGLNCGPQIGSSYDQFTGNTIHEANISTSSGLIGNNLIIKANRVVSKDGEETFILRIIMSGSGWLFIESITMKNPSSNWEKSISWKNYDVSRDVITGTLISEKVSVIVSREEFIAILSQNHINARLYGKDSYSTFSFPNEKLVAWKQLLSTKMEL